MKVISSIVCMGAEIQIYTLLKLCTFKKISSPYEKVVLYDLFYFIFCIGLYHCGKQRLRVTYCKVKFLLNPRAVFFFPLQQSQACLCCPFFCSAPFTRLLNCSNDFPSNIFWKSRIITAFVTLKLVLKAFGMSWQKNVLVSQLMLNIKKYPQRHFNTFFKVLSSSMALKLVLQDVLQLPNCKITLKTQLRHVMQKH